MEPVQRPKRLWFMVIMHTLAAGIQIVGVGALMLLSLLSDAFPPLTPELVLIGLGTIAVSVFLIVGSWLAFFRYPNSRRLALIAAALFYGLLVVQFVGLDNPQFEESRRVSRIIRTVLEFAITAWALYSEKTTRYFADKANAVLVPTPKD